MATISERVVLAPNAPTAHLSTAVLDVNLQLVRFSPWQKVATMYVNESVNLIQPYLRDVGGGMTETVMIRTPNHHIELPFIVSLRQFVFDPYAAFLKSNSPIATKRAILSRDRYTCAYCGKKGTTVDHIFPKSRGGGNTWENLITACDPCNNKKADRTPDEAGMVLMFQPETYDGGRADLESEIHDLLMREAGVVTYK